MTMVWCDPAGFAADWDWHRTLTVWALAGRRFEPRFHRRVLEHKLAVRPADERQAQAAARHWWRTKGRALRRSARPGPMPGIQRASPDVSGVRGGPASRVMERPPLAEFPARRTCPAQAAFS